MPIVLEYSMTARPHRPVWLTVLRAAGVAVSFVVGAVGGYAVAFAITIPVDLIAGAFHPAWMPQRRLGAVDAAISWLASYAARSPGRDRHCGCAVNTRSGRGIRLCLKTAV